MKNVKIEIKFIVRASFVSRTRRESDMILMQTSCSFVAFQPIRVVIFSLALNLFEVCRFIFKALQQKKNVTRDTTWNKSHFVATKMALKRLQYVINAFLLPVSKFIEHYKNAIHSFPSNRHREERFGWTLEFLCSLHVVSVYQSENKPQSDLFEKKNSNMVSQNVDFIQIARFYFWISLFSSSRLPFVSILKWSKREEKKELRRGEYLWMLVRILIISNTFYMPHNRNNSNKSRYASENHFYNVIILIIFMNIEMVIATHLV